MRTIITGIDVDSEELLFSSKEINAAKLFDEIVAQGFVAFPDPAANFFGFERTGSDIIVHVLRTMTQPDKDKISTVAEGHEAGIIP